MSLKLFFLAILMGSMMTYGQSSRVLISEFMAVNTTNITDEDGEFSDWLEIYNNTDSTIQLSGWYLSDDASNLKKWIFPAVSLASGEYKVIFASGKDRTAIGVNLHTNFKLSGSGEYLAVSDPDTLISHAYAPNFPGQRSNVSFGIYHGQEVFFNTPTPGSENVAGTLPFAPVFSQTRGFFDAAFDLSLTSVNSTDKIYYTLNGTRPTATNATLYAGSIHITKTTPVSAIAVNSDGQPSEIVTNSYIFPQDVFHQSKSPAGFPSDWGHLGSSTPVSDYGMDSRVIDADAYKDRLMNALKALPTINVVTNIGYLFSKTPTMEEAGMYIYTGKPTYKYADGTSLDAYNITHPSSVEYFDPATGKEFQLNCQLKLHGGNGRLNTNSPKHGFEFGFKSIYGPSKLNFDIFEEKNSVKEFNTLILRPTYNNSWTKNSAAQQSIAQFITDPWAKNLQLLMKDDAGHERFVHLYLDGVYWGIYNITEQLDAVYMADYLKGSQAEFDIIKGGDTSAADGNMNAWNSLKSAITSVSSNTNYQKIQGKNPDGTINSSYANLLDVDNYIDYMLINYYMGNLDWKNNWTVARNRVLNTKGFRFFCWDTENSMVNVNDNKVTSNDGGNPNSFIQYLMGNTDFKLRFADRVQKEVLTPGGLFHPSSVAESYVKLADEVQEPLILESARWSDWYAPYNPYTVDDNWIPRKEFFLNDYFPNRADILIGQLKAAGYLPNTEAPVFSLPAGNYDKNISVGISASQGKIYYTTDGTDPRKEITGAQSATASLYAQAVALSSSDTTVTLKARALYNTEWSALNSAKYTFELLSSLDSPEQLALSVMNYPNPFTAFTRISLELPFSEQLRVDIVGLDGRLVAQLFNGQAHSGTNELQWTPDENISRGIYICRINYMGKQTILKIVKN